MQEEELTQVDGTHQRRLLDQVFDEFMDMEMMGIKIDEQEFCSKHPEIKEQLEEHIMIWRVLQKLRLFEERSVTSQ